MRRLALLLAAAPLLVACGTEKGPCLHSHQEYSPPIYIKSGSVMVPVGGGMHDVCDKRGPVQ